MFHNPTPPTVHPSLLSCPRVLALTHSSSFAKDSEWGLSKTACVIMRSSPSSPPVLFPPIHSHPPLPIINPSLPLLRTRNARVHSRLNEVNIAGMQPYVIAGPTPTKTKGCLFKWGTTKDHWGISMCRGGEEKEAEQEEEEKWWSGSHR